MSKSALLVVRTHVARDPRVRRQIDWLVSDGWTVDTLGLGDRPDDRVRHHFRFDDSPWPRRARPVALGLVHLLPYRSRFRVLSQRRIPEEASRKVRDREYDLLVLNDTHLAPWLADRRVFAPEGTTTHIHMDIHEYFPPSMRRGVRGRLLLNGYYKWVRGFIGHPLVNSRSVASTMAEEYAREFTVPEPFLVRNCPDFVDQRPSPVDPQHIRLIHHGVAAWRRGFKEMVEAMRLVDDRFTLTFMLAGNERTIAELKAHCADQAGTIAFAPAAPMRELAAVVNSYDAEVMFFPRASGEPGYALPNKLFEAIQGRLALVIGPTPPMVELVTASSNGVIADDWSPEALARAINSLTHDSLTRMKLASDEVAALHTSESEREKFLRGLAEAGLR